VRLTDGTFHIIRSICLFSVRYLFNDFKLGCLLLYGPCTPYRYRLEGPNSWQDARQTIITQNKRYIKLLISYLIHIMFDRVEYALRGRRQNEENQSRKYSVTWTPMFSFMFVLLILLIIFLIIC
jgi:hypothetical protein